jgi:RecQ family ATP-dependent DNA helicase
LENISKFILEHRNKSGIIYCCTKKDCERVASDLRRIHHISIKHYHAGMTAPERSTVQREWQQSSIQVIAATIAFGMGIDKPDVRFVVHFSVPSSLEGYYQETGRAGRDGLPATCRLYFGYQDIRTHTFLIEQGDGNWQQKARQKDNLNTMVKFVDNEVDCRRKQIMSYFGERFDPALCNRMCDNCIRNQHMQSVLKDMSREAVVMINLLQQILPEDITMNQLAEIYRGSKTRRIMERGHNRLQGYGGAKNANLDKTDVDRLCRALVAEGAFNTKVVSNGSDYPSSAVVVSVPFVCLKA